MSEIPSLYQLTSQYQALTDMDIPADEKADTLDLLQDSIQEKGKNIGFVLQSFDAQETALKAHLADVQAKIKAIQSHRDRLKDYLKEGMERCDIQKIESPYFTISLQKSPGSVVIDDENLIPDDYFEYKRSPRKSLIKEAISEGYEIPGCHIEAGNHVRIR